MNENNGSPIGSLTERIETLDRAVSAIAVAVNGSGGKTKRLGHKTVAVKLPGSGNVTMRLVVSPARRMTPGERTAAEDNVGAINKRARRK